MSIIRIQHSKEKPYVMLNKQLLNDENLSWAAKGLLAYLISRPDNWKVCVSHLTTLYKGSGGGRDAIRNLLSELIENGYCIREKTRNEANQYNGLDYVVLEEKLKEKLPQTPFQAPETPAPENTPPTNNIGLPITETSSSTNKAYEEKEKQEEEEVSIQAKKIQNFSSKSVAVGGEKWLLNLTLLEFLIEKYGFQYVVDQFNGMLKKQKEALHDEKINKNIKTIPVEYPEKYLKSSCQHNYAFSKNQRK